MLAMLAFPVLCVGAGAGEDGNGALARLVRDLGAPDLSRREAAYREILAAGERDPEGVLACLPSDSDDHETREAVLRLRRDLANMVVRSQALREAGEDADLRAATMDLFASPSAGTVDRLVRGRDSDGRRAAARILSSFLRQEEVPDGVRAHAAGVLFGFGKDVAPEISRLVVDPHEDIQVAAVMTLCRLDPERLVPFLAGPDAALRGTVAELMVNWCKDRAVADDLAALLPDPDREVRRKAALVLSAVGPDAVLKELVRFANGSDPSVSQIALYVLGTSKDGSILTDLARIVSSPDSDEMTRLAAAHAMKDLVGGELAEGMGRVSGENPFFHPGFQFLDFHSLDEETRGWLLASEGVDARKRVVADQIAAATAWWERNKGKWLSPAPCGPSGDAR